MRYQFQTMNVIDVVGHREPAKALTEFNQNRQNSQQERYRVLGYSGRLYIPSTELLAGDMEFLVRTSGEGFQYDGITTYYDTPQDLQACVALLSYPSCTQKYSLVVHSEFAIFVRKEPQILEEVTRFVDASLSTFE